MDDFRGKRVQATDHYIRLGELCVLQPYVIARFIAPLPRLSLSYVSDIFPLHYCCSGLLYDLSVSDGKEKNSPDGLCSVQLYEHACMTRRHGDRILAEQIRHDETSRCRTYETRNKCV